MEELVNKLREFADPYSAGTAVKSIQIEQDDSIHISRMHPEVSVKTISLSVACDSMQQVEQRVKSMHAFLTEQGFKMVEEDTREDMFAHSDGMMARITVFEVVDIQPQVKMTVHIPNGIDEAYIISNFCGLDADVGVDPKMGKEAAQSWDKMSRDEREEFLQRKAGLKPERASHWTRSSFAEIEDAHPFLAQRIAKDLASVRV